MTAPTEEAEQRAALILVLQTIVRNDNTHYRHHPALGRRDGTIWLTPRELAMVALTRLGAPVPNALEESLAPRGKP